MNIDNLQEIGEMFCDYFKNTNVFGEPFVLYNEKWCETDECFKKCTNIYCDCKN